MKSISEQIKESPWKGWVLFFVTLGVFFLLGLLASTVMERRAEAVFSYVPQVKYGQYESRNEVWGQNFPRQYESYTRTADTTFQSKHGGSATIDMLEEDPRLVVLWAGYAFSKAYNQGRGHYHAIEDVNHTLRTGAAIDGKHSNQPSTCWTCKSPDVPRLMSQMGVAEFYKSPMDTKGSEVVNNIGCADCHDAETMNLRITRPALVEAFERQNIDVTKATHQEMRSLVCAQCHVEYYFDKKTVPETAYLTFPWEKGFTVEAMEAYYDEHEFTDFTHALSKTPILKAQHPDYELFKMGTHASRGVSCADCHMPYKSEGGVKFTDHHIQSPLNNVANSCQVCHREETERLVADVYSRQDKIAENRLKLEDMLVRAHVEAKYAWEKGATEEQMKPILTNIRHAQWRWDFAAASHGASFHAPVETSRIIASGMDIAQNARIQLARLLASLGYNQEIPYPAISNKAEAQKFIGLDLKQEKTDKQEFLNTVVPQWIEEAKKREAGYVVSKN